VALVLLLGPGCGDEVGSAKPTPASPSATVAVEDGTVHYSRSGKGTPVILLHGLFAQKEQWDGVRTRLASAGFDAVAPDLPGYGESAGFPITSYDLERQVELLAELATALGLETFDIVGNSMGGTIAALFTERHPDRVRRLAFVGPPLGVVPWGPGVRKALLRGVNPFIPADRAEFELEMSLLFARPPEVPASVRDAQLRDYADRRRHYQQVWDSVNLYDDVLVSGKAGRLAIDAPVLILWGASDGIYPASGAKVLQGLLPGSTLVVMEDAGHLPMLDRAAAVAARLIRFLSDRGAPVAGR
jgi:pimeloyl-ACP methyl ester carboxylesterase